MVNMKRYQEALILRDLKKKMVLLAGPRQAGKTTLAKEIGKHFHPTVYLNFDRAEDRKIIREEGWLSSTELLILDEIHKMPKWKNYLKGIYDTKPERLKILVTGSARLEVFRKVGDSLAGRYFLHHLMPLSPAELTKVGLSPDIDRFLQRGGFPEPYLDEDPVEAKRWRMQYVDSLLKIDVLDFENIQNLRSMQLIFDLLRQRVGTPVSLTSLAEDVAISPNTVKKYIQILEALYIVFRVTPFSKNIARSLLKEPKIYFFDTGLVEGDEGKRFENFCAVCLYKHILAKLDFEAEKYSLHYLRTKEQHEVDFALVKKDRIERMIEVKLRNHSIEEGMLYFHKKYQLPGIQIVKDLMREKVEKGIEIVEAKQFLSSLFL